MNLKPVLLSLIVLFTLSACVGGGATAVPEDHYYRLPVVKPGVVKTGLKGVTAVSRLESHGLYLERSILYISGGDSLRIERYHYHHWLVAPAYLVQDHMVEYLRAARVSPVVAEYEPGLNPARVIRGRLHRFERVFNGQDSAAVISMELAVTDGNGNYLLWPKVYKARVAVAGSDMNAVAHAFGQALARIYQALLADLGKKAGS